MHRSLRILSVALITAGLVILADVATTLAWKEPVSTIYGSIQQRKAERASSPTWRASFPSSADLRKVARVKSIGTQGRACSPTCSRTESTTGRRSAGS